MATSLAIGSLMAIAAYLLGSLPTGYLLTYWLKGIDIRECGSGSTGATNVLRTVGKGAALVVLVVDLLKGAIAVALVKIWFVWSSTALVPESWESTLVAVAALAAIVGHSKSIWLNFSGGKSVATSLGVLLVMSPWVALGTLGTFGISLALSRIVSLSSLLGAIAVNLLMLAAGEPTAYIIFAAIAGVYVFWRHQTNIQRLLAGTEPKIGQKLESKP